MRNSSTRFVKTFCFSSALPYSFPLIFFFLLLRIFPMVASRSWMLLSGMSVLGLGVGWSPTSELLLLSFLVSNLLVPRCKRFTGSPILRWFFLGEPTVLLASKCLPFLFRGELLGLNISFVFLSRFLCLNSLVFSHSHFFSPHFSLFLFLSSFPDTPNMTESS